MWGEGGFTVPVQTGLTMIRTLILTAAAATLASLATPRPTAVAAIGPGAPGFAVGRDADGLFRLTGTRGTARLAFVVDTGATATVLSPTDAARLGVAMGAAARLSTAGGEARMRWGRLTGLRIAGRDLPPLDVVVPDAAPPHPLLGQDAIAALGRITIEGERMTVAGR
jgi:clan AA aspartic protease (TIGR02281 family)